MSSAGPVPGARALAPRGRALLTASVGIAHAALFLLSYWLLSATPRAHASDEELAAFYQSGEQRRMILVGLYVMPFAGITFVWFTVGLRTWIRAVAGRTNEMVSGIQFVSGILYVALFFAGAAAESVMAVAVEYSHAPVDPVVARQLPLYGSTLLLVFAMRVAAMFVFTTSAIVRGTGILPRWFAYPGLAVGLVLLFSATFHRGLALVFPLWLLALCALLLARARRVPKHAPDEARDRP